MARRCLETRTGDDGFVRRRYALPETGKTLSTIEVPLALWRVLNRQGRRGNRTEQWLNARRREVVKERVLALIDQGWKPEAISSETNVPTRTVQRWRKQHRGA